MCERATLAPPDSPGQGSRWERTYPGAPDQLRRVRADLRGRLRDCPVAGDAVQLLSELAANAVLHSDSRRPGGTFTVRVRDMSRDGQLWGEVQDEGSGWDGDLAASAEPPHGLYLLTSLASSRGVQNTGRGRVVWFCIDFVDRIGARS
jgi:serine/threonine-protein kinase RsbW